MRRSPTGAQDRAEYKIHVAVQKRVAKQDPPGLDQAAIDGLMQLVQEIDDLFRHKPLAGFAQAHGPRPRTSRFTTQST